MNLNPRQHAIVTSAVAGVFTASLLFTGYRLLSRRHGENRGANSRHSAESTDAFPVTQTDVSEWLSTTSASPATIKLFARHHIDGDALAVLAAHDLVAMGVPAPDRVVILTALANFDEVPPMPRVTAGYQQPPRVLSRRPLPQSSTLRAQGPPTHSDSMDAFLTNAEGMFTDLVNPSQVPRSGCDASDGIETDEGVVDPQQHRLLMASRLYDLLEGFQTLSTTEQTNAMLPLARRLNTVLTRPISRQSVSRSTTEYHSPSPAPFPTRTAPPFGVNTAKITEEPSPAPDLAEKMKPLHDMLDSFVQVLQAPDLDGVPAAELEPLASRIAAQIGRVGDVADRLPQPLGLPLQRKCQLVDQLLEERLRSGSAGHEAAQQATGEARAPGTTTPAASTAGEQRSVAALLGRLRNVFQRTRDDALLEMESGKRLVVVNAMIAEVESIQGTLAAMAPSEQVQIGQDVSENVLALLEQLRSLTIDEARLTAATREEGPAEKEEEAAGKADDDGDSVSAEFASVTASFLERIAEVLQSPQYVNASSEEKRTILGHLTERVGALGEEAKKLSPSARAPATQVIAQAKQLLSQAVSSLDPVAQSKSAKDTEQADQRRRTDSRDKGEEEEEEDSGEEGENAGIPSIVPPATGLDDAIEQVERIFELLNSERFQSAPIPEKKAISGELLKRVRVLKGPILRAVRNDTEHPIMTELVIPLEKLLQSLSEKTEPSEQLREIVDVLKDMKAVLSSAALSKAPRDRQKAIARATIQQLQRITATFASLSPSERATAETLVAPLNAELVALVRGGSGSEAADTVNPKVIIDELQTVTSVLQGAEFTNASLAARDAILQASVAKLEDLLGTCANLSPSNREQLTPLIENMLSRFKALSQTVHAAASGTQKTPSQSLPPPRTVASAHATSPEDEQRGNMFESLRDITKELKQGNTRGIKLSEAETQPLWQLLAMFGDVDNLTEDEVALREAFTTELKKAGESAEAEDADAGTTSSAKPATAIKNGADDSKDVGRGDDNEEEGEEDEEDEEDGINAFLRVFYSIQKTLDTKKFASLSTLLPIMSVVEGTLTTADERGVPWQQSPVAVKVVSDVLAKVQAAQAELRARGGDASSSVAALTQAKAQIEKNPPQTRAELTPYLDLLKKHMSTTAFAPEEMAAMEELKDALISAGQRLKASEGDKQRGDADEEEKKPTRESRIADAILELSDKLRDNNLTNADLDQCETVINQLSNAVAGDARFTEAIESVREQIRLQRILNAPMPANGEGTEDGKTGGGEMPAPVEQNHASPGAFDEDDADTSSVAVDTLTGLSDLQELSSDGVVGGPENEVTLLPKIEERIALPTEEFTAACSLFDIQNISKVLLHLSTSNAIVKANPDLLKRVEEAKAKFITQLAAFRSAENASAAAQSSSLLKVTGEDHESGAGSEAPTHDLVVFTAEEGDQYSVNAALMNHLQETKNVVSPTIKSNVAEGWKGTSKALLVYAFEGSPEDESAHSTALSELLLLHEVLTKRYGFDVVTITDPRLDAESFMQIVKKTMSASHGRMFVYFSTPPSRNAVAVPQAMTFHDDSVLEYSRILEETRDAVERVVVVHSLPRKLEMVCRLKDKESPAMSVRLTNKAAKEVAKVRCWLYDGVFTPVVVELLCRDERLMLCPEDLINYAVTATTRLTIEFGSFTDSEPASMAFFLPTDN